MSARREPKVSLAGGEDWDQLARNAIYRASQLAKLCNVSLRSLERFFRKTLNTAPQRWLNKLRDMEAARMALKGSRTKEIAHALGYAQPSYLCRVFKSNHGVSIRHYKAEDRVA